MKKFCLLLPVLVMTLCCAAVSPAGAQSPTVLHDFGDGTVLHDGANPTNLILGRDGNFYGTTAFGGAGGEGTVFQATPTGSVTVLHAFSSVSGSSPVNSDGTLPVGVVQGSDGSLYGLTAYGGSTGFGVAFRITTSGSFTILHVFGRDSPSTDGQTPAAPLVEGNDGNFYGTTTLGGTVDGTVFRMTPTGTVTILHNFDDGSVPNDGITSQAALIQASDGNFYGTTSYGGDRSVSAGTVFKITPQGVFTILYRFEGGSDGIDPLAPLVQGTDGNFYGTTEDGGVSVGSGGVGTIFKITPTGTLTTLHVFDVSEGGVPAAGLIQGADGNLYGTAYAGGLDMGAGGTGGNGTIFRITPDGVLTTLYYFNGTDGANPDSPFVVGTDGNFYGITDSGGSANNGVLFSLEGPSLSWTPLGTAAAPDGTARLLWTRSDGAAGLWSMSQADTQTSVGSVYGPYPGWHAANVSAAGDGTARVLWTNTNGEAGLWNFNAAGAVATVGPAYGPYTGWHAASLATAPDGTSRLLWTRTDGAAGVWTLDANGRQQRVGSVYGPYSGWTAKAVGTSGDDTARILWSRDDGAAGIWTLNAGDVLQSIGATYGPYSDSHGTWSATDMGTSSDGTAQVLWTRSDGAAGVWTFSAGNEAALAGPVYGPYAGYTATALNAANDQARILWVRSDQAAGLWTIGGDDAMSTIGSVYGPF